MFRIAGQICRAFHSPGSHRSAERGHEDEGARDYKGNFLGHLRHKGFFSTSKLCSYLRKGKFTSFH